MTVWLYYMAIMGPPFTLALAIYAGVHTVRWVRRQIA
jgi:hypothetical protein